MAKIIEESPKKSTSKEFINRQDYEYTLKNTFVNTTIVVAALSVYITFAYITISYLKNKKTD